jgi:hypothetical protein
MPIALSSPLPPLLLSSSGEVVDSPEKWNTSRRPEILKLFENHVFGALPDLPTTSTLQGETVVVTLPDGSRLGIRTTLVLPEDPPGRVPLHLLLWIWDSETIDEAVQNGSEKWPVGEIVAKGCATAAFCVFDLAPDNNQDFRQGILGRFGIPSDRTDCPGALAAWAWGASRVLDALLQNPRIDASRVSIVGHSRGGKAALWAGALDRRFALVVANGSGCTGAALSRRKAISRESVRQITDSFPYWFCPAYRQYADHEDQLPVDQHMLLALIAPRAVLVCSAEEDYWADPEGEALGLAEAAPAFELFGQAVAQNQRLYHCRPGGHALTRMDWLAVLAYAPFRAPAT